MQRISEHLADYGHDVRVLTSDAHDLEYFWSSDGRSLSAPERETHNGVAIERLPVEHGRWSGKLRFGVTRRLMGEVSRVITDERPLLRMSESLISLRGLEERALASPTPDLVHVTNLGLESIAVTGVRVARRLGVPYVITPFTHIGRDDDQIARRYVTMPHQKRLLLDAAAVVLMTNRERDFVAELGVNPAKTFVVGAGVDTSSVCGGNGKRFRAKHGIGDNYLVAALGALAPDKGTVDLVEAVSRLRRRGLPVSLLLAGPELSTFRQWFEREHRTTDGIHRLGIIDDVDKRDLLAAMDVLALPSRTESFGIVYLEAWSLAKPVIAARAGGVPDVVRDEENGLLVEFGDIDALGVAIERLKNNAALAVQLGRNGRKLVTSAYTWEDVADRAFDAYDHALRPARVRGV